MPFSRLLFAIVAPIAISLSGCIARILETPAPPTILIQEPDYRGVLFSAAEAERRRLEALMTADTVEFWSPSVEDITRMEAQILPALLTDERLRDGVGFNPVRPLEEALPDYGRQYFGYFNTDGEAVIYASFFCDAPVERLIDGGTPPADGGDCFFQIHYNTDTGEYLDLYVHGEA
ncbi:hypothetical protein [Vacuolonema iberomarrocanum]|uniref:hypothetical protein n=1 Tax=Vacuolonema iberomarrocanum TaxID=3454632 RepID=UPI0019E4CBD1|nr:hypothetical protein [filamentous cyanobacterium LEGE 07170]